MHDSVCHYLGSKSTFKTKNYDGGLYGKMVSVVSSPVSRLWIFLVGIIPPTPACRRALEWASHALTKQGHDVINLCVFKSMHSVDPARNLRTSSAPLHPSPRVLASASNWPFLMQVSLILLSFLRNTDRVKGAGYFKAFRKDESMDPVMSNSKFFFDMPLFVKKFLAMLTRNLTGDEAWASLLESLHTKTAAEERALVVARDEYRARWYDAWDAEGLDFVLSVPFPLPAIPTGTSEKVTMSSLAPGMICNIVRINTLLSPFVLLTPWTG